MRFVHAVATVTGGLACRVALLAMVCCAAGCATELRANAALAKHQSAEFAEEDLKASTAEQGRVLELLQARAGLATAATTSAQWDDVIAAGVEYADAKCEAYMGALTRLNRDKKTTTAEISLVGTAAAGVMAAAKSAARDIALAAIAFGLASSTVDNLGGNVLYEIDPSSVRTMVKTLQSDYRMAIPKGYTSRPAVMKVIRGYAALCTPVNIEAELNLSVKKARPKVEPGDGPSGKAPEVSNAELTAQEKYAPDDSSALLNDFLRYKGVIVKEQRQKLEEAMDTLGVDPNVDILEFLNKAPYASQRLGALRLLHLTN